jgi:hypothetical protein
VQIREQTAEPAPAGGALGRYSGRVGGALTGCGGWKLVDMAGGSVEQGPEGAGGGAGDASGGRVGAAGGVKEVYVPTCSVDRVRRHAMDGCSMRRAGEAHSCTGWAQRMAVPMGSAGARY